MTTIGEAYRAGLIGLRTHNALRAAGHEDLASVMSMSNGQLLAIRGVGPTVVDELRQLGDNVVQDVGAAEMTPDTTPPPPPVGLGGMLLRARATFPEVWWEILRDRSTGVTLEELGRRLGVTRERIRQIEVKATSKLVSLITLTPGLAEDWTALAADLAVREARLFDTHLDDDASEAEQVDFGRFAACAYGFRPLKAFGGAVIRGWWTSAQQEFLGAFGGLTGHGPMEHNDLNQWAESNGLPDELPWVEILPADAGPLRYHPRIEAWVRSRAVTRDAACAVLSRRGAAMSGQEVAEALDIARAHNIEEQMRRDGRFRQLRPSGLWVLVDWNTESRYSSTFEAVIDVLRHEGPQTGARLGRAVAARYPVTRGAVQQCLSHESIGRWPDGRVDLVERGAPHPEESRPRQPRDILLDQDGSIAVMYRAVDVDLMRGSGLGVSRFLGWILGLRVAPRSRVFEVPGYGEIEVRRLIQGTTISSLRRFALKLGADLGCRIAVRFDCRENVATVGLACDEHAHANMAVLGSGEAVREEEDEESR